MCFKTSGPGPYSMSCLTSWWLEAGCLIDGHSSPTRNTNDYWHGQSVATVKYDMSLYVQLSVNSDYYLVRCYGN